MKQTKNSTFTKNIGLYAKITRKCLVCDSVKFFSNELGISCDDFDAVLNFEENSCMRI